MQIDETDRHLIDLLRENARLPVADIARKMGIARTTVQARLDRLEQSGVILGYTVRTAQTLAPTLYATALVSVEPRSGPIVIARLKSMSNVDRVHTTSGRFDLLVGLSAKDTEELDQTLDRIGEIKGVKGSESLIHLSTKVDRRG